MYMQQNEKKTYDSLTQQDLCLYFHYDANIL